MVRGSSALHRSVAHTCARARPAAAQIEFRRALAHSRVVTLKPSGVKRAPSPVRKLWHVKVSKLRVMSHRVERALLARVLVAAVLCAAPYSATADFMSGLTGRGSHSSTSPLNLSHSCH